MTGKPPNPVDFDLARVHLQKMIDSPSYRPEWTFLHSLMDYLNRYGRLTRRQLDAVNTLWNDGPWR